MSRNSFSKAMADDFRKAAYQSIREFIPVVAKDLHSIMEDEVADDFYNDYQPGSGGNRTRTDWRRGVSKKAKERIGTRRYSRRFSLYDILDVDYDENDMTISWDFNPEAMTFRSGYGGEDGLYDLVFKEGWHGGARSGPYHPGNGDARWRYPNPFYTDWFEDDPAERAAIAPIDNWKKKLSEYEKNTLAEKFERLLIENLKDTFR